MEIGERERERREREREKRERVRGLYYVSFSKGYQKGSILILTEHYKAQHENIPFTTLLHYVSSS